jgi:hypothetical protein
MTPTITTNIAALEGIVPNPRQFGAVGDGVADDFTAITKCFAAAFTLGVPVHFLPGTYKVSKAIIIEGFTNLIISAVGNVKILFPSADQTLTVSTPGYDLSAVHARSAFYIKNCTDLVIKDLQFEGNSTEVDIQNNSGLAISCGLAVTRLNLLRVTQRYGAGLVTQRDDADSKDALIEACRSYGSRANSRLGNGGTFFKCAFELPATAEYNRVGNNGSSHAIYQFAASGDDVSVKNCRFVNIRMDGVKVSGSASPSYGYSVEDCVFINCGRNHDGTLSGIGSTGACVVAGADDNMIHAQISIQNNRARNCGEFAAIAGSKNVQVVGNQIHHTVALSSGYALSLMSVATTDDLVGVGTKLVIVALVGTNLHIRIFDAIGVKVIDKTESELVSGEVLTTLKRRLNPVPVESDLSIEDKDKIISNATLIAGYAFPSALFSMISISRYRTTSEPVEDIVCAGNHFTSEASSGTTFVTHAIALTRVGLGLAGRSSFPAVRNNHIGNGYLQGMTATDCLNPVFEGNGLVGLVTAMVLVGCRMPRIIRNDVIDQRSNNAQIRMSFCSWPILAANIGCGGKLLTSFNGKPTTSHNNSTVDPGGSENAVGFPLAGFYGRVQPTGLHPEVVFAYGSGWTDGDVVQIVLTKDNKTFTFTFKAVTPGNNQFDSITELINKLNNLRIDEEGHMNAPPDFAFIATDYGKPWKIVTNHIRVQAFKPTALANFFKIRTVCANPTAGVILRNSSSSNGDWSFSRGEGESGDRVVIWSPCIGMGEVPRLAPENLEAANALETIPYPVVTSAEEDFAKEEAFADGALQLPAYDGGQLSDPRLFYWRVG